jgi:hypothetical protein
MTSHPSGNYCILHDLLYHLLDYRDCGGGALDDVGASGFGDLAASLISMKYNNWQKMLMFHKALWRSG